MVQEKEGEDSQDVSVRWRTQEFSTDTVFLVGGVQLLFACQASELSYIDSYCM